MGEEELEEMYKTLALIQAKADVYQINRKKRHEARGFFETEEGSGHYVRRDGHTGLFDATLAREYILKELAEAQAEAAASIKNSWGNYRTDDAE